jgi:hypothetical protein
VIITQADMWDRDGNTTRPLSGEARTPPRRRLTHLQARQPTQARPGLRERERGSHRRLHHDPESATWTQDAWNNHNGITTERPNGYDVPNFHRLTVHGSTLPLEWVSLLVDPRANNTTSATSFGPFSRQRMIPS